MTRKDLIKKFPEKKINPQDGMAVTATVWKEAHEYHRLRQQLYDLFSHGPGIVTGLDVEARDEPGSEVCISPGIAMDGSGQIIVLPDEIKRYDFEAMDGSLYLLLSYSKSQPRYADDQTEEERIEYIHDEYIVEVGQSTVRDASLVELARIRRQVGGGSIVDAQDPEHPGLNEIDLRFRRQVGSPLLPVATIAVSYVGGNVVNHHPHGRGISYLARALRRSGNYRAWADLDVPLAPGLEYYTLVCLVGQDAFDLSKAEMESLYNYVQSGGTLFIESCRREIDSGNPPADAAFGELLKSLGFKPQPLTAQHELLVEPFLFATPPPGFENPGKSDVWAGDGVILSTRDYGCLWQGARRQGAASREEIRTAEEWGTSIVAYALNRRNEARNRKV